MNCWICAPGNSGGRTFFQCRARDHDAGAGAHNGAALDYDRGGRPQGGAGRRGAQGSTSSRSGSTTVTASTEEELTPEIYGAIINEAHARRAPVTTTSSISRTRRGSYTRGVNTFAHGVRDKDIDDELVAMFRQVPNLVLTPNLRIVRREGECI